MGHAMRTLLDTVRFTLAGREWLGRWVVNEADTILLPRLTTKGPPWPNQEEYGTAVARFREISDK